MCAETAPGVRCAEDLLLTGFFFPGFLFLLLALVVMPLDGEEHAGDQNENFEDSEDYRDPSHV